MAECWAGCYSCVIQESMSLLRYLLVVILAVPAFTQTIEQGKFRLHKFEQSIGEEKYTIQSDGNSLNVSMDFKFVDRGSPVMLTASFHAAPDLTPQSFHIAGNTSRVSQIDDAVEIEPGKARLRNRAQWTEAPLPKQFFTIAGYSPTTMQMLMVRYWSGHGSPAELAVLPSGSVKIEPRGQDTITIGGHQQKLDRYTIEGLIWGRETLWFDEHRSLVAEISVDAEFDHFEAIRDDAEEALPTFVARAGADNMDALASLSKGISGSRAPVLAIVGATLIDGTGSPAMSDSAVLIDHGRIVAAGPRSKIKIPKTATVIQAQGKTIMPGLWDMHAHFEQVEWGPIYLAAGVTTVRDCGNELEFITAARDAVASGHGLGPRILAAGIVDGSGPFALGVARVDTPEQALQWVDRYHAAGFQQMKIYSSIKLEMIKAVAEEAHRLGMTVTGHVPRGLNAYQVIEAGQDQINHITYIMQMIIGPSLPANAGAEERSKAQAALDVNSAEARKAFAFLKEHHTVLDPTVALYELFTASTDRPVASFEPGAAQVAPELSAQLTGVPPPSANTRKSEEALQKYLEIIGALHRAGVTIVAGTDQAVPGHTLHREIELYVQAGFTPMEAIQAATIIPARVMSVDKEVGTVEAGKRADLIILSANPLDDIHNTRKVDYVITNGVMYNTAELWRSVGFKPAN